MRSHGFVDPSTLSPRKQRELARFQQRLDDLLAMPRIAEVIERHPSLRSIRELASDSYYRANIRFAAGSVRLLEAFIAEECDQ